MVLILTFSSNKCPSIPPNSLYLLKTRCNFPSFGVLLALFGCRAFSSLTCFSTLLKCYKDCHYRKKSKPKHSTSVILAYLRRIIVKEDSKEQKKERMSITHREGFQAVQQHTMKRQQKYKT